MTLLLNNNIRSLILALWLLLLMGTTNGSRPECIIETTALLNNQEILAAYESVEVKSNNDISDIDNELITIEYSSAGAADNSTTAALLLAYKEACETNGGIYVSLDFTATCLQVDDATDVPLKTENLAVSAFPRCYGISCHASDDHELFQRFTLRPTEELNAQSGISYMTCSGSMTSITNGSNSSTLPSENSQVTDAGATTQSCLQESAALGQTATYAGLLKPTHTSRSWHKADTSIAELHQLNYTMTAAELSIQGQCESAGGVYYEIVFINQCGPHKDITYSATNVPRCGGPSCKPGDFDFDEVAKLVLFHTGAIRPGQSIVDGCPIGPSPSALQVFENSHTWFIVMGVVFPILLVGVGFVILTIVRKEQQKRLNESLQAESLAADFEGSANMKDTFMLVS